MTHIGQSPTAQTASVHLINHTHWDREWFLTHEYTTAWIPDLIDALDERVAQNADYQYLFDGQTLVIEDLIATRPDYRHRVRRLVAAGSLGIGPVYSQADWRIVCGQLHLRNLQYGTADAAAFGGSADVAWLVDLFGHVSQVPQMLSMVGVDAAYVWRGVPAMHPAFDWVGADGSSVLAVDLFGGYRNLYGISRTADIAVHRLVAETRKLEPHYGGHPIPLFDGYDLDTEPEDPARHYEAAGGLPADIEVLASSPRRYVEAVAERGADRPAVAGELLSGRFGATFPGSLATRSYLKVLHHDAEQAVLRRAEPLAAMAAACGRDAPDGWFEQASRELLRNGVHDCICGVSIDQVHERMERSYRRILDATTDEIEASLATIMARFRPGTYAVSTTAFGTQMSQRVDDRVVRSATGGIGVWPVTESVAVERCDEVVERFAWSNDHFSAEVDRRGLRIDGRELARLVVRTDDGDTYSSEIGPVLGTCETVSDPVVESRSDVDAIVSIESRYLGDGVDVRATLTIRFDAGPVVEVTIDLDSDGCGFRVDAEFDTGVATDTALAAMPFDLVERAHVDDDLLPREIDPGLASVLMGQREVDRVEEFPMHGFVALRGPDATWMALGRGIRSYRSGADGSVSLALRRSVEWVARTGLAHREGDAGPALYVPGARCERSVRHELGIAVLPGEAATTELYRISETFEQPPLVVEVGADATGSHDRWPVFGEDLPITGIEQTAAGSVVRTFNPDTAPHALRARRQRVSVAGGDLGEVESLPGKVIADLVTPMEASPVDATLPRPTLEVHGLPTVRVGRDRSRPDPAVLAALEARRGELQDQLVHVTGELDRATGEDRYRLTHRQLVLDRERAELELSIELNRRRLATDDIVSIPDHVDPEIARLGRELNDLRIDRRIYDYVVAML
ncbi:MAG: hypothetical protein QNJ12_12920 [Ilumatobacter sp.]|uniref:glycoside hydrolase family 38 N-terminal domain-containing protein n=1 Tax=Ilumatobacter sp. TaxID=1967498 RepID=UPI002634972E|nr:hypothetical protein [Ilumatobacter sp.]MDJ0769697.1 hypothetical protein [Ilumatobacter sp.]